MGAFPARLFSWLQYGSNSFRSCHEARHVVRRKPSVGLEPRTLSLPWIAGAGRSVRPARLSTSQRLQRTSIRASGRSTEDEPLAAAVVPVSYLVEGPSPDGRVGNLANADPTLSEVHIGADAERKSFNNASKSARSPLTDPKTLVTPRS